MRCFSIFLVSCLSLLLVQQSVAQCGMRRTSRIVNGETANVNEFPMMAAVFQLSFERKVKKLLCGATILSNDCVLTSAACLQGRNTSTLFVLVGDHDLLDRHETPYTALYNVTEFNIYPEYDPHTQANDIAIIKLKNSIVYNAGVGSVCLPPADLQFDGTVVEAVGWGTDAYGGQVSTVLQKVELNVVSNSDCNNYYGNIQSSEMCTYTPNRDTCQKDAGGPVFAMIKGRLTIAGIISHGHKCATEYPSVHTRVTSFLPWIKSNAPGAADIAN